jgi:hypothetical protein
MAYADIVKWDQEQARFQPQATTAAAAGSAQSAAAAAAVAAAAIRKSTRWPVAAIGLALQALLGIAFVGARDGRAPKR